ncbi:MAG: nitronate monooxygenase [Moraxellaceae bacterium]|nr:nitronate monooxygenase [Moraxellaceae bacterium]
MTATDLKNKTLNALDNLTIPAIASPMFLVSNPKMLIETCKSGMVGSLPTLNQRTNEGFEQWLNEINQALADENSAPYAINLVVHKTNKRLEEDLASIIKYQVPIVITSLGINQQVIDKIHSYGGLVFHDVTQTRHAKKAMTGGVDGLILVCAGAGGHAGTLNPFAFVGEVRQFYTGKIIVAGCISSGADIASVRAMGADFAYMGTRFIATKESNAKDNYKQMVVDSHTSDILYTPNISGISANFLVPSLVKAGIDPNNIEKPTEIDLGEELTAKEDHEQKGEKVDGVWTDIWSAGQGVGSVDKVVSVEELVNTLKAEYDEAKERI